MAIVREFKNEDGVTIKINDECLRNQTPEQREAARRRVNEVVSKLLYEVAEERARQSQQEAI